MLLDVGGLSQKYSRKDIIKKENVYEESLKSRCVFGAVPYIGIQHCGIWRGEEGRYHK